MLGWYPRQIRAGFRRYPTYWQAGVAGLATTVVFGFRGCAVLLTVFVGSARLVIPIAFFPGWARTVTWARPWPAVTGVD